ESCGEGMIAVHLDVAVGRDEKEAGALEVPRQMDQEVEGAAVGPVEVFQDDRHGLHAAGISEKSDDGLEEPPALLLGIRARRGWLDPCALAHLGDDARNLPRATPEV